LTADDDDDDDDRRRRRHEWQTSYVAVLGGYVNEIIWLPMVLSVVSVTVVQSAKKP
jgi:hypothetical protein